jgi:L-lysine 6-transaminase
MAEIKRLEIPQVAVDQVHPIISRSMLKDGMPLVVDLDRSHGSRLFDASTGRSYLDFFSYFATQPLGHNHPAVTDPAFREHIGRIALTNPSNSDVYTQEMAAFVETLRRTAQPSTLPYVFMVAGGALAVENALKAAFDWKYQKRIERGARPTEDLEILHFREAFHGRSGYTLSLTNTDPNKVKWFPKFDWPRVSNPKVVFPLEANLEEVEEAERRAIAEIERAIGERGDRIAALIIEPIQGEGGDNHFRGEFLRELRRITLEHELLLIVDEVQTGMGTTGRWWAYQHFDFEPDLLCFGKKMQVCGFLAGRRLDEVESVFKVSSRINSTWGGNLVDMVRGTRYLQVIVAEDLLTNAAHRGEHFLRRLTMLRERHGDTISNVRGRGLFVAFTLPSREHRNRALELCRQEGLLLLKSGISSLRARPPLSVHSTEIDEAVEIVGRALARL